MRLDRQGSQFALRDSTRYYESRLFLDLLADPAGSGTIPSQHYHRYSMRSWAWVVGVEAAGVVKWAERNVVCAAKFAIRSDQGGLKRNPIRSLTVGFQAIWIKAILGA